MKNIKQAERPRRHRTVEEKRRIVEETLVSGASVSVVARRHDVNANQVFSWRGQYRRGELGNGAALVPVGVIGAGGTISATSECVKPKVPAPIKPHLAPIPESYPAAVPELLSKSTPPKQSKMIEVELRGGTRIRIDADVKGSALQQVLKLIRSLA